MNVTTLTNTVSIEERPFETIVLMADVLGVSVGAVLQDVLAAVAAPTAWLASARAFLYWFALPHLTTGHVSIATGASGLAIPFTPVITSTVPTFSASGVTTSV